MTEEEKLTRWDDIAAREAQENPVFGAGRVIRGSRVEASDI
jgi:hypothetical protein